MNNVSHFFRLYLLYNSYAELEEDGNLYRYAYCIRLNEGTQLQQFCVGKDLFIDPQGKVSESKYIVLITKEDYMRYEADKFLGNYFSNSVQDMFSFFVRENKIDLKDAEQLLKMIDKIKD